MSRTAPHRVAAAVSCLLACAVPACLSGEPATQAAPAATNRLAEYLASIDAVATNISTFTARFTQTIVDPAFDETDVSSGSLELMKRAAEGTNAVSFLLRFDYLEPERQTLIVTESKVVIHRPGFKIEEQALADDAKLQSLMASFTSVARIRDHFSIALSNAAESAVTLTLTPVSATARQTVKRVGLSFDTRSWLLKTVCQEKLNGQESTLELTGAAVNAPVDVARFSADSLGEGQATNAAGPVGKMQPGR